MGKQCILNNCRNTSGDNKVFKFPFKDPALLAEWLEQIPKGKNLKFVLFSCKFSHLFAFSDLYVVIENPAFICEHHFEKKFIRTGSGFKRLNPKAIPTIFNESKKKTLKSVTNKRLKCPDHK